MRHYLLYVFAVCLAVLSADHGKDITMDQSAGKSNTTRKATFAGGCFWCMEPPFEQLHGVIEVTSGYSGGSTSAPTYQEVSTGSTGHYEAVQILYDPDKVSYAELLDVFWRNIDPTDQDGQFADRGTQYLTAIFYHDDEQRQLAQNSKEALEKSAKFQKPIATRIIKASEFYPAEGYHQDYYVTNPLHYNRYKKGSGRESYLAETWPKKLDLGLISNTFRKPSKEELKRRLSPLQFNVTQENGTEPPFRNDFFDHKEDGIYVDIVSGEPLFSSRDKFDSGCGWPSFSKPLDGSEIKKLTDRSHGMVRTEVRSKLADSHLGHLFEDGPAPTGLRYCINSASLRFIPADRLEKEGYGKFQALFSK